MTVQTPFPERPATPFWDRGGKWGGMGNAPVPPMYAVDVYQPDYQPDTATEVLNAITAGSVAATQVLQGGRYGYQCPVGYGFIPATGMCQQTGAISGSVSASGNSGLVLLLIAGAAIWFMRNR